MFLRLYFIIQAVIVLSPVNKLYAKRICFEAGFEPNFGFQLKAATEMYPYITFCTMTAIAVLSFAEIIRIFERPYYEYSLYSDVE